MAVFDLYSTRNKPKHPEVYQYEMASQKLRTQLTQIVFAAIGTNVSGGSYYATSSCPSEGVYAQIYEILCKEYGEYRLMGFERGCDQWLRNMFDNAPLEQFLDTLELSCKFIDFVVRKNFYRHSHDDSATQKPDDALKEINERMKRDGFGFEYSDGILIKVDEQFIHAEAVKPALYILQNYEAPRQEFLEAHEHYRHSNFKECLMSCGRAFEGMMKIICDKEGWEYNPKKAGASNLIALCKDKGLFETHTQEHLNGLAKTLESGVPPIRNEKAGHAKPEPIKVSEHITKYTLHLTAVNLVFLNDCYEAMKK
ncbi:MULTISPECIES: STM4504/CBY_0614 family protein [unclassified Vibrio]|uniref:STM4504/CBY_0614 family protein n=1 Tax=unclassified Vibrio TaxID=2614977 RepID=UPI00354FEBB2